MMADEQELSRNLLASEARNLHAVQKNAKAMMLRVIDHLEDYPEAKARLQDHLRDKDNEMQRLEQILAAMGQDASGAKDVAMSAMGAMTGMMTGALEDDILKTSMMTYGLANYEVAAYESMSFLAEKAGQPDAVPLLKQCAAEERAMADWLHEHMQPTLERYLRLRAAVGRDAAH